MILSEDVNCTICSKIFCCKNCREKHEIKHKDEIQLNNNSNNILVPYFKLCPICNGEQYLLNLENLNDNLISHIAENHLPLRCSKCTKIFHNISDLMNHSKCLGNLKATVGKKLEINNTEAIVSEKKTSGTQTSPFVDNNKIDVAEIEFLFNYKFKVKNKLSRNSLSAENISTSMIKNISSINSSSIKMKTTAEGKLVRTTSTPLQELFAKRQSRVFDSLSNEHVSSIYNSHSESDISPPIKPSIVSPRFTKNQIARIRKSRKPVTPLRQVMSNSIRKAINEQTPLIVNNYCNKNYPPKVLFDESGASPSVLDLRTTPVLRRIHSEITEKSKSFESFSSAKTSTKRFSFSSKTESIFIKSQSKLDTIYKTCQSIELITKLTEESHENKNIKILPFNSATITPKVVGVPKSKKIINFKTPINATLEDDEIFYTPKSCNSLKNNKNKSNDRIVLKDNKKRSISLEDNMKENTISSTTGKFWSLVSSFVRLPSFSSKCDDGDNDQTDQYVSSSSIIKRCSSLKDYFSKSISPPDQHLKRKRTASSDLTFLSDYMRADEPKRPKRILGRRPIERMRNNS